MSVFFTVQQGEPTIRNPSSIIARDGKTIIISGEQFKRNILQISGENIFDSSANFLINGLNKQNISGINNTLSEDVVGFTISGVSPSKYNVYVYNDYGKSTNSFELKILDKPQISGFDASGVLPGQYVRVSGYNLNPGGNVYFIDNSGSVVAPSFIDSGLYRVTGYSLEQNGTGYALNDTFTISGIKNYYTNSNATLTINTTGLSGSLGSFEITDSGIFTVPNLANNLSVITNSSVGTGATINLFYEKYVNTGKLEFLEFQIPFNLSKNQSGIVENLEYRGLSGAKFEGFYISGYPNIYGFNPNTGLIDSSTITITGDNLTFVDSLKIGTFEVTDFTIIDSSRIDVEVPNYSSSNYIYVSGRYGSSKSSSILNVFYPPVVASGFTPNDVLAGTGALITISGKYLQRINYINLGAQNVLRKDITVEFNGRQARFPLPNNYTTTKLNIFSVDFPNSGTLIESSGTNDLLISTVRLADSNVNIKYLSGIQGAKYLDEILFYTPSGTSGDYGNLTNSEVFFLGITGHIDQPKDYLISGIKLENSATGIKIQLPREIRNPQARIKIKRNRFGDEYILPSNKSIDVLPTIFDCSISNTTYNDLGYIRISGINASNTNLVYFSGYSGTTNLLGYKPIDKIPLEIIRKNSIQITGSNNNTTGYTVIEAKLGGDVTGSGELFLFNNYFDTGIGYEDYIITQNRNVRVAAISGFRPPNSDIFTSPAYITTPLENAFFYQIQTNSRATRFEVSPTTISGVGQGDWPTGIENYLNSANQIFGQPIVGGIYYLKIRALDGERPNEGMILNLAVGYSGRSLSGPGITYRGDWKYGIGYVGSNLRRDIVKYRKEGVNYWYAAYTNLDSEPQAGNPNWIPFTNEFAATATQVLLAEESNITNSLNIGQEGIPSGFIKTVNDKNVDEGSGFYLGYDNRYNVNRPKFRVGNQDNYIKFDGDGLDILGPLSGIITTSKNIKNANNIVNADSSIALGINNRVIRGTENVFIFGTDNRITGSRRSSIVAGRNNEISTVKSFFSDGSTIGGGESNRILGSFCNIVGGFGNIIDATSTGLSTIANQLFTTRVSGIDNLVLYPNQIFTNELALILNFESQKNIYRTAKVYDISTTEYTLNLYPEFDSNDPSIKVYSWVSLLSPNLYSGSFVPGDNNGSVCEFKVGRTGLTLGSEVYRINFTEKFVHSTGNNQLVVLANILANDGVYKLSEISGLDSSGFYLDFPGILDEDVSVHYFAGNTGYYTGVDFNEGFGLEISRQALFENLISGTGYRYDIPLKRKSINFFNIYDSSFESMYIGTISGDSNDLKIALAAEIDNNQSYAQINSLGFTGQILDDNIQVYQTGLNSGEKTYFISLLSGIPNTGYIPICNLVQSGDVSENIYLYFISGKNESGFYFQTSDALNQDVKVNVSIYKTGNFSFDNSFINAGSLIVSGSGINEFNLAYQTPLNFNPKTFVSIENVNNDNIYIINAKNIFKTGLSLKLSESIVTDDVLRVNYVHYSNTGLYAFHLAENQLIDKDTLFTGDIVVRLANNFNHEMKVFGKVSSRLDETYLHHIYHTGIDNFSFTLSSPITPAQMTGLIYEYMVSDLDRDYNVAKSVLSTFNYARLGAFGFNDIGSSTIGGGTGNYVKGLVSSIAGGVLNEIIGDFNLIPGGRLNRIIDISNPNDQYPKSAFCTILGGSNNIVTGNLQYTNIVGGSGNIIINDDPLNDRAYSSIIGGASNEISGAFSTILGGENNTVLDSFSHVLGRNITVKKQGSLVLSDASTGVKNIDQENTMVLNFSGGLYITGYSAAPIVFDLNTLPTSSASVPIGGVYRNGAALHIRLS